jgi:hypothetical protein
MTNKESTIKNKRWVSTISVSNDLYNYFQKERTKLNLESLNKTIRYIVKDWIKLKKEKMEHERE